MKFFVAGGTGAIGRPLIGELLARGHAVVALSSNITCSKTPTSKELPCAMASSMVPAHGSIPTAMLPDRYDSRSFQSLGTAKASGRGYTLKTRHLPRLRQQSMATREFI